MCEPVADGDGHRLLELKANPAGLAELHAWLHKARATLVYAARDTAHNSAGA